MARTMGENAGRESVKKPGTEAASMATAGSVSPAESKAGNRICVQLISWSVCLHGLCPQRGRKSSSSRVVEKRERRGSVKAGDCERALLGRWCSGASKEEKPTSIKL